MPPWPEDDGTEASVFIIIGQVTKRPDGPKATVHVMLKAPDEDSAVRETLNALAREGFAEAELDQIGLLEGMPDEEPHASAYEGVIEGEVAVITFD
ncbi:transcriptional regulator [Pseudohoeflea sp. DP4N28-3]|uniref:Transcriptional regulator n=1 Tax=Pseudohoeflea coraliihabitans TaxID=2860393 RepID=A0ABS6WTC7_9HYPH|nr:transcriptional regulator [Pseudohoeflea sp. DP4N28-3]